jgi:hypothetical protein
MAAGSACVDTSLRHTQMSDSSSQQAGRYTVNRRPTGVSKDEGRVT